MDRNTGYRKQLVESGPRKIRCDFRYLNLFSEKEINYNQIEMNIIGIGYGQASLGSLSSSLYQLSGKQRLCLVFEN